MVYNLIGKKGIRASACTFNIGNNTIELPKSGEGRTACLTVVCCGQIAVFRGNLRRWMRAIVVERNEL